MKVIRKLEAKARNFGLSIILILLIVIIVLVIYWQDFVVLANEAIQNEAMSHIILVPLLDCFLIYRKREHVKASLAIERLKEKTEAISLGEITGIAFWLSAVLLYWYGSNTFYPLEYHIASVTIIVIGITFALFNIKTLLVLIFPILFLIFLIPPPPAVILTGGAVLGSFSTQASYTLLKIIGVPVTLSSQYGPPTLVVNNPEHFLEFAVDLPCSGIYSLVAFIMFATFLVYIIRGSTIKKIVLFPLGFLMLAILNILRISFTVLIAYRVSEEIATTIFHIFSGWILIFMGMLLLLVIADRLLRLRIFADTNKTPSCPKCDDTRKSNELICRSCGNFLTKNHQIKFTRKFWIKITALLLASYLATLSVQAPTFAFAQGLTITNRNPEASTDVFPEVTDYQLKFLYRDQNFEKVARQDASLLYAYISQDISKPIVYVLVGVASSITNLHSWEVCLVSWQTAQGYAPAVNVLESKDIQIMQNPPITARYFVFQHPANYTQTTLYWYQKALFKTGLTIEPRYIRISLIILTQNPNDSPKLEQKLLNMGQSIAAYWEPLKAQTFISLGIPAMQVLLSSTMLIAITLQACQYTKEWRRKINNLKIFERLASPHEKLLYQTIKELRQKTRETTTQNIAPAFEKATGKAVKPNELTEMLINLKKHGIINVDLVNIVDQPRLVWKP